MDRLFYKRMAPRQFVNLLSPRAVHNPTKHANDSRTMNGNGTIDRTILKLEEFQNAVTL